MSVLDSLPTSSIDRPVVSRRFRSFCHVLAAFLPLTGVSRRRQVRLLVFFIVRLRSIWFDEHIRILFGKRAFAHGLHLNVTSLYVINQSSFTT